MKVIAWTTFVLGLIGAAFPLADLISHDHDPLDFDGPQG